MPRAMRICLYSTDDATGAQIRHALRDLLHLRVVTESSQWEEVRDCVNGNQVDMVLVDLDPDLDQALQTVQLIVRLSPEMGIIGVSARSDPQTIIKAMRAGCSQFVCSPIETDDLNNAIARIESTRMTVVDLSRRICVIGSTGGMGVTTLACNLALELTHLTDRPSALVDLNLEFGDVACAFDCKPKYSVADLAGDGADIDRGVVEAAMHVLPCNVHLLARPESIEDAHRVAPEAVERLLDLLASIYPNVVLDLPRGFNFFNAAAVNRADLILIVAQLSVPSIRNARRVYELLIQMRADPEKVEIVLNRCKADFERITPDDVERHFARRIFGMIPNDYRRVQASKDLGHPMLVDSPNSPARMAIHEMAKKIATELKSDEAALPQRKGLLGRLWGKKQPAK